MFHQALGAPVLWHWRSAIQELNSLIRAVVMENNAMPENIYVDEASLKEIRTCLIEAGAMSREDAECRVQVYPLPHPVVIRPFTDLCATASACAPMVI